MNGNQIVKRSEERQFADERPYHPLPRHKHASNRELALALLGMSLCTYIVEACLPPEFSGNLVCMVFHILGFVLPLALVVIWLIWSAYVSNRCIEVDPETGHKYATDLDGTQIIFIDQCANDWIDVENKVISHINDTDIPYAIPDGKCVEVNCRCFDQETVKLRIAYHPQYEIRDCLDRAVAAAYPGGSIHSSTFTADDGKMCVDYFVKY